jgi:hypothetical protein
MLLPLCACTGAASAALVLAVVVAQLMVAVGDS